MDGETKEIVIHCKWETSHLVEVPVDFEVPGTLDEFPQEVLEQLDTLGASLVDWS